MLISVAKLRELAVRVEGRAIDYKLLDYPWASKAASNAELAKDLMALANRLAPTSEPAYILIGVADNGSIVGITTPHLNDASLQQKVGNLLNKVPDFSYGPVEVDGRSVGVYEIRPGGRPFFARSESPPLQKGVALVRVGSTTERADPDLLREWAKEDDVDARAVKAAELRTHQANAKVRAKFGDPQMASGPGEASITLHLHNVGPRGFDASICEWRVEWKFSNFSRDSPPPVFPENYEPPSGQFPIEGGGFVPPAGHVRINFKYTRAQAAQHCRDTGANISGFNGAYGIYHFAIRCEGELGGTEIARCQVSQ